MLNAFLFPYGSLQSVVMILFKLALVYLIVRDGML